MVQIFIKCDNPSEPKECYIIELQGELEVESGEDLSNRFMGDLHFNKDGTPIMILGHHILYGKVCNMDKPIVLLKKHKATDSYMKDDSMDENLKMDLNSDDDSNDSNGSTKTKTEYLIDAVVRRKIVFNKRPRPIVVCGENSKSFNFNTKK